MSIQISSEAFSADEKIPIQFTADGQDISPKLQWGELPPGTKELALIVDDPDAPREQPFVLVARSLVVPRDQPDHARR